MVEARERLLKQYFEQLSCEELQGPKTFTFFFQVSRWWCPPSRRPSVPWWTSPSSSSSPSSSLPSSASSSTGEHSTRPAMTSETSVRISDDSSSELISTFPDVILTEVDTGMPCAEGPPEKAPMGSYTCRCRPWFLTKSASTTAAALIYAMMLCIKYFFSIFSGKWEVPTLLHIFSNFTAPWNDLILSLNVTTLCI